jgi:hypothetical protein
MIFSVLSFSISKVNIPVLYKPAAMDKGDKAAGEIPSEIITDIIVRLPIIKGIINSSSVCKVWHNLIFGQPYFADMHLRRSSSHETLRFSLLVSCMIVLVILQQIAIACW